MTIAYLAVTFVAVVANAAVGVADLARARFVLGNCAAVGVPPTWLIWLGLAKIAGAAGLVTGLLGVRPLGVAAAVGLVLFFVGAVVAHLRARVLRSIGFPAGFLALACAALAGALAQ